MAMQNGWKQRSKKGGGDLASTLGSKETMQKFWGSRYGGKPSLLKREVTGQMKRRDGKP